MAVEHIHMVKRTLWVSKCPGCGDQVERADNPPRERYCNACKQWVPFAEETAISPEYGKK
jgi:hypothetical protein